MAAEAKQVDPAVSATEQAVAEYMSYEILHRMLEPMRERHPAVFAGRTVTLGLPGSGAGIFGGKASELSAKHGRRLSNDGGRVAFGLDFFKMADGSILHCPRAAFDEINRRGAYPGGLFMLLEQKLTAGGCVVMMYDPTGGPAAVAAAAAAGGNVPPPSAPPMG